MPSLVDTCSAAYPLAWRIVAGTLRALAGASLPAILLLVVLANDPPVTPPVLARLVVLLAILPAVAAWLVGRVFAAELEVGGGELIVRRRDRRLEVPCDAIARVRPWAVPLPAPGLSLRLRSGRRLGWGLALADPTSLLGALAAEGGVEAARSAMHHPTVVWAHARVLAGRPRWYQLAAKFGGFALAPAAVLFYTHQHISYGGTLGQYHLEGLGPYLRTAGVHWATMAVYLVLWASVWRGLAEGVTLLGARVAPSHAARVRRAVEIGCRVVYYGGVPLLLLLRYGVAGL